MRLSPTLGVEPTSKKEEEKEKEKECWFEIFMRSKGWAPVHNANLSGTSRIKRLRECADSEIGIKQATGGHQRTHTAGFL